MKEIAVVILNWNGRELLEKFLPTVIKYSEIAKIYIIDNASTDDSVEFVKKTFPSVEIIEHQENLGFAGGYNEGLKSIKEPIYCLLNSDVEVTENWLEPIMKLFNDREDIAVIQPKILSYYNRGYFEASGAGGGFIDNLGYPYCRGRIFDSIEKDLGQYDDEKQIFWASGCSLFIRRGDFWRVGGLDSLFFAHQEEIDLCWRLNNIGRKVFYTGKSTIYHIGGATLDRQNPKKTYLNMRNNLLMLLKNLPVFSLVWVILLRLVLDFFAGLYFGYRADSKHILSVVKAHFSFYYYFIYYIKNRSKVIMTNYYESKWLVFRYFLFK